MRLFILTSFNLHSYTGNLEACFMTVSQRLYCMSFSQGHVDEAKKGAQLLFALRT